METRTALSLMLETLLQQGLKQFFVVLEEELSMQTVEEFARLCTNYPRAALYLFIDQQRGVPFQQFIRMHDLPLRSCCLEIELEGTVKLPAFRPELYGEIPEHYRHAIARSELTLLASFPEDGPADQLRRYLLAHKRVWQEFFLPNELL